MAKGKGAKEKPIPQDERNEKAEFKQLLFRLGVRGNPFMLRVMRKLFRLCLFLALGFGLLVAIGLGIGSWWVMRNMGPEIWVQQAETAWNCRAQIEDAKLSLFTRPASLTLKGVKLVARDDQVALPYAERQPLSKEAVVPVYIPEAVMEVSLEDLLSRRLNIKRLRFVTPQVNEYTDATGRSSLEQLFAKPGSVEAETPVAVPAAAGSVPPAPAVATLPGQPTRYVETPVSEAPVPRAIPVATPTANAAPVSEAAPEDHGPPFRVSVQEAAIDQGTLYITSGSTQTQISELDFAMTDIDVDSTMPQQHNHMKAMLKAHIVVMGMARIAGAEQKAQLADLRLVGEANIRPLDPATGEWNAFTAIKLNLQKGSTLAGHMTIGDAAGDDLRKLEEYGIDLAPVVIGGPLVEDAVVAGNYRNNQFETDGQTRFAFPQYEVVIGQNSWVNAPQDRHDIRLQLSTGPELQARLESGIAQKKLGDSLARAVTKAFADERGRMTFDVRSEGSLSDPKVRPSVDRVLKNLLRGQGLGDLLQGLFKRL